MPKHAPAQQDPYSSNNLLDEELPQIASQPQQEPEPPEEPKPEPEPELKLEESELQPFAEVGKQVEKEDEEDPLDLVEPGENWGAKEEEGDAENHDAQDEAPVADEPKKEEEPAKPYEDFDIDVPDAKEESMNETPITVKECHEEIAPKERDIRIRKSINREKASINKEEPIQNREAIIERMKQQNSKLKKEFAQLKGKLEECIAKAKQGYKSMNERPPITEEDMST